MQARVKAAFENNKADSLPFVKELYKKARNNAKKYEQTLQIEQSSKGKKLTEAQTEKLSKQQSYSTAVDEAIETLSLFLKHYKPDP